MKSQRIISLNNFLCSALLLVMLIMLCQPFWGCEDCKSHKDAPSEVSISEYLWMPRSHNKLADDMTDYYKEIYGKNYRDAAGKKFEFKANEILPYMMTAFLGSVAGIFLSIVYNKKFLIAVIPLIVGLACVWGYTTCPALMIGKNVQTHLIVAIILSAVSALSLIIGLCITLLSKKKAGNNPIT